MDEEANLNTTDVCNDVEEGELEDGELDENVEDGLCKHTSADLLPGADETVDEMTIVRDRKESRGSKSHHEKKKKSKKRKRDESKTHRSVSDHHQDVSFDCETPDYYGQWSENPSRSLIKSRFPHGPCPYDSPYSSEGEFPGADHGDASRRHYDKENDDCDYERSPKIRRTVVKHREKKARKSRDDEGDAVHFEEFVRENEFEFDKKGREGHRVNRHKPRRQTSSKKRKNEFFTSERNPVCKYFLEGNCIKGDECSFSHVDPQKRQEVCRFYLAGECKKSTCLYYHDDWPCKDFHMKGNCDDGDMCRFSHADLNEETDNLLSIPDSFNKRKIPSLLDMEIPPPDHLPKRSSSSPRGGGRGFVRSLQGKKPQRGFRRGGMSKFSFGVPSFGIDDLKSYGKDLQKPETNPCKAQDWERNHYNTEQHTRTDYDQGWTINGDEDSYKDDEYDYNERDDFSAIEQDIPQDFHHGHAHRNNQFVAFEKDQTDEFIGDDQVYDDDNPNLMNRRPNSETENDLNVGHCEPTEDNDVSLVLKSIRDQHVNVGTLQNSQPIHQPPPPMQQPPPQIPNILNLMPSMLHIPPPQQGMMMPIHNNILRGMVRPNGVPSSQPGILGAAPIGGSIITPPAQSMVNHNMLPQHPVRATQVLNQFISPQQPNMARILGQGPRVMFPSNLPPMGSQQYMQMPPFPPPRFDLNQIISNIVRNSAAAVLNNPLPGVLNNPLPGVLNNPLPGVLNNHPPAILSNPPPAILSNPPPTILNNPPPMFVIPPSSMPCAINSHTGSSSSKNSIIEEPGDDDSAGSNNSTNTSSSKALTTVDPRLRSKDGTLERTEVEIPDEDEDDSDVLESGKSPPADADVLEVDGTAKKVAYVLRPISSLGSKPSIPGEILLNFKDFSLSEDPRLKKYSRSLTDFNTELSCKFVDPRNQSKKSDKATPPLSGFSSPLLSPTDPFSNKKLYGLPDIFIPPVPAPNIEFEDPTGSGKIKTKRHSILSPTSDTKCPLTNFPSQVNYQLPEALLEWNSPIATKLSADNTNIKVSEESKKKVIDYRNDPRFKKKKTRTKSEEELKDKEFPMEPGQSPISFGNPVIPISTEHDIFTKPFAVVTSAPRIPSPNPTFPLYCTSFRPSALYSSSSTDDFEDADNASPGPNTPSKEDGLALDQDADDFQLQPALPATSPVPFYHEHDSQSPDSNSEISIKDMFKTIDPTTSPFC